MNIIAGRGLGLNSIVHQFFRLNEQQFEIKIIGSHCEDRFNIKGIPGG